MTTPLGWSEPINLNEIAGRPPTLELLQGYGSTGTPWSGLGPRVWETGHDTDAQRGSFNGHAGIDIAIPQGTPLHAMEDGVLRQDRNWTLPGHPIGYAAELHPDGSSGRMVYGHVSQFAVPDGTHVKAGDVIAFSGGTPGTSGAGFSTGPHLHLELRNGGNQSLDPSSLIQAMYPGDSGPGVSNASNAVLTEFNINQVPIIGGAVGGVQGAASAVGTTASVVGWIATHVTTILFVAAGTLLILVGLFIFAKPTTITVQNA